MSSSITASNPNYRTLELHEINVAVALRADMVREMNARDPDEKHPGWRKRYFTFFSSRVAQGTAALFVAEVDGHPIGISAVYLPETHRSVIFANQAAYVTNVYVHPKWRKRSVGSELTRLTVDWAKQKGCEVVRLRTSPMGRSVYAGVGFVPSDEMELRLD